MNRAGAGRTGRRWLRLRENLKAQNRPCWLCGQPINPRLRWPHPASFSVDHRYPLSTHPHLAEDPAALMPSHLRCNVNRGARDPKPSIGDTSRDW